MLAEKQIRKIKRELVSDKKDYESSMNKSKHGSISWKINRDLYMMTVAEIGILTQILKK